MSWAKIIQLAVLAAAQRLQAALTDEKVRAVMEGARAFLAQTISETQQAIAGE